MNHDEAVRLAVYRGYVKRGHPPSVEEMAVQLARRLASQVDVNVPPTVAFDHPDVEALTTWLLDQLHLDPLLRKDQPHLAAERR